MSIVDAFYNNLVLGIHCDIGDVLFHKVAQTDKERQQLENYIAHKL